MRQLFLGLLNFLVLTGTLPAAQDIFPLDQYLQVQPEQVLLFKEGKSTPLEIEMTLVDGAIMETNGVLKLPTGVEKKLSPGAELSLDGFYITKDGRFVPVLDHYAIQDGKITFVQDGQSRPVEGAVDLKDVSKIKPDGWLVRPDGTRRRLLDGQQISPDGKMIPAQDFVMNKDGKIILQKDGALFPLDRTRTMAMSDATKVRGDAQITRPDGTNLTLKEGQRLSLPGPR